MKVLPVILILVLAAAGCTTKSSARRQAELAYLAGQKAALPQTTAQPGGVTIIGAVQNPQVPWVAGLTLAQAVATASYTGTSDPKQILITRQGETATLDVDVLLNGATIPLEPGDVVEIH